MTIERRASLARELTERTRGAMHTAVGLGVLGVQRLQVARVALSRRLAGAGVGSGPWAEWRAGALRGARQLDDAVGGALHVLESSLEPVTTRLPGPARHLATLAQSQVNHLHAAARDLLAAATPAPSSSGTTGEHPRVGHETADGAEGPELTSSD